MISLTERILENCDYLREKHNVSKSELEKSCGVSLGYFSRLRKLKGVYWEEWKRSTGRITCCFEDSRVF